MKNIEQTQKDFIRQFVESFHQALNNIRAKHAGNPLSNYEIQLLNLFLSYKEPILNLYIDSVKELEEHPETPEDSKIMSFKQNMDSILLTLTEPNFVDSRFQGFHMPIIQMLSTADDQMLTYCEKCDYENLPKSAWANVEQFIKIVSTGLLDSVVNIERIERIERQANASGFTISHDIKKILCSSFIQTRRNLQETFGDSPNRNKEIDKALLSTEKYFLDYLIDNIPSMDRDALWHDDIVFMMMQLKNNNDLSSDELLGSRLKQLDGVLKGYVAHNYSPEDIQHARETINEMIFGHGLGLYDSGYCKAQFDDSRILDKFVNAYKTVYLYELLTGEQKEADASSPDVSTFLLRQLNTALSINPVTNQSEIEEYETIIIRAAQDKLIKQNQIHQRLLPEKYRNMYNDLTVFLNYTNRIDELGGNAVNRIIRFVSQAYLGKGGNVDELIVACDHELDHHHKYIEKETGMFFNFNGYKVMKSLFAQERYDELKVFNYDELQHEQSAERAGSLGLIRALKTFPAGDQKVKNKKHQELNRIITKLIESARNKINIFNPQTQNLMKVNFNLIVDALVFKLVNDLKGTTMWQILQFEYYEDGTEKSLEDIMQNMESEIQTGIISPKCGPTDICERAKLRLQIMMERAIVQGREEECYKMITGFYTRHGNLFKKDDVFRVQWPDNLSDVQQLCEDKITKNMYDYEQYGYMEPKIENARFFFEMIGLRRSLDARQKNANQKRNPGRDNINRDGNANKKMPDGNGNNKTADGSENKILTEGDSNGLLDDQQPE